MSRSPWCRDNRPRRVKSRFPSRLPRCSAVRGRLARLCRREARDRKSVLRVPGRRAHRVQVGIKVRELRLPPFCVAREMIARVRKVPGGCPRNGPNGGRAGREWLCDKTPDLPIRAGLLRKGRSWLFKRYPSILPVDCYGSVNSVTYSSDIGVRLAASGALRNSTNGVMARRCLTISATSAGVVAISGG